MNAKGAATSRRHGIHAAGFNRGPGKRLANYGRGFRVHARRALRPDENASAPMQGRPRGKASAEGLALEPFERLGAATS